MAYDTSSIAVMCLEWRCPTFWMYSDTFSRPSLTEEIQSLSDSILVEQDDREEIRAVVFSGKRLPKPESIPKEKPNAKPRMASNTKTANNNLQQRIH